VAKITQNNGRDWAPLTSGISTSKNAGVVECGRWIVLHHGRIQILIIKSDQDVMSINSNSFIAVAQNRLISVHLGRVLLGSTVSGNLVPWTRLPFLISWVLRVLLKKTFFGWFGWSTFSTSLELGWNCWRSICVIISYVTVACVRLFARATRRIWTENVWESHVTIEKCQPYQLPRSYSSSRKVPIPFDSAIEQTREAIPLALKQ